MSKKDFKVMICKYLHNDLSEQIKKVYNDDDYFNHKQELVKISSDDAFFIIGILDGKVIGTCFVERNEEDPNYFLLSDFFVLKSYRNKGYGTKIIEGLLNILKKLKAIKICAFANNEISAKIFSNTGFKKDLSIKSFGDIYPDNENAIYFEMKFGNDITR